MPAIFRPSANLAAAVTLLALAGLGVGGVALWWLWPRTDYARHVRWPVGQPVPFSHEHHVGGLGIDCRYCHTSVEDSPFAGMPSTKTCMTCHSQIWTNAQVLEPVRASWRNDTPIHWTRVYDLPDFAYFNHAIHVNKGVGCSTCHGPVDQMPLTWKATPLTMEWCLGCHRQPEQYLRPRDQIYNMAWKPPHDQESRGRQLLHENEIRTQQLLNCSICHR
jgi:hypothetical protein